MILVYETHSTTTDNERGIATGWNHGELSETGKRQAAELGARHRDPPPDLVLSSDLRRAVDTVEIAFGETDVPRRGDARLRECHYGDLNGAPVEQVEAQRTACIERPFPRGESYADVVERTSDLLRELTAGDARRILFVAHRAQYYALEHLLRGVPLADVVTASYVWQPGWQYELTR